MGIFVTTHDDPSSETLKLQMDADWELLLLKEKSEDGTYPAMRLSRLNKVGEPTGERFEIPTGRYEITPLDEGWPNDLESQFHFTRIAKPVAPKRPTFLRSEITAVLEALHVDLVDTGMISDVRFEWGTHVRTLGPFFDAQRKRFMEVALESIERTHDILEG